MKNSLSSFNTTALRILISCLLFVCATTSIAQTSVWKVSDGKHSMYIGGTIHILGPSDFPLPGAFDQAYKQSEKLIFEADMPTLHSAEFQQRLMGQVMYLDGSTIKDKLSPQTYQTFENYLTERGMTPVSFVMFKPGMISITLMMMELQNLGMAGKGVDAHYYQLAVKDKKKLGHLEDVNDQIRLISQVGVGKEDEFIQYTIGEMKNLKQFMTDIKIAWRKGDAKGIERIGILPLQKDFPELYDDMLVKRNKNWLAKLEYLIKTPETELVLVGAAHLPGKDGVLAMLKQKGYKITQQ